MNYSKILPDYPRTHHLPYEPNAQRLDLIATEKECEVIFNSDNVEATEKCDGANCGCCFYEGHPIMRNRNHFLQKGKTGHLSKTPAKLQFSSIYNWFYSNIDKFEKLNSLMGFEASVYGEWLVALHGLKYDKLPDYFMAYDIYDWQHGKFICPKIAREMLELSGFNVVPLLHYGKIPNWKFLGKFCEELSPFSTTDLREGVYIKVSDGKYITHRFKMVRRGFIQGGHWNDRVLTKNKLCD